MQPMTQTLPAMELAHPGLNTIAITLYELIEAVSEEVQPGEDRLVTETMLHLFDTDQVKFSGKMFNLRDYSPSS
ncbi:MAG: hypothetical protein JRI26_05415 [Deltaproteobacteria bacterium]|nr:hypothetical protein [Deltaproteobacteria bacterium]